MLNQRNTVFSAALAVLAVGFVATRGYALDLTNLMTAPGFEIQHGSTTPLAEGYDVYPYTGANPAPDGWKSWATNNNGNVLRVWNPAATDVSQGAYDASWGGNAPEGLQVMAIYTRYYDYNTVDDLGNPISSTASSLTFNAVTYDLVADSEITPGDGGHRNFEAVCTQIDEPFDPTAKYTLTVQVGRLAQNGVNSATVVPVFNGYNVSLMAGGVAATGSRYAGWIYGNVNDPNAADYIGTIAEDNNTQTVPDNYLSGGGATGEGGWALSTVAYIPSTANDLSALAGKDIVIRLAMLEGEDHSTTSRGAYDDVHLTKIMAGDTNDNDLINIEDLQTLAGNFGSAGDWSTGDFDGDGTITIADLQLLAGNFGFDGTNPASPIGISLGDALELANIPEPTSMVLFGLAGLGLIRRRRGA